MSHRYTENGFDHDNIESLDDAMRNLKKGLVLLGLYILASCNGIELPEDVAVAYGDLPEKVDFNLHVKPILSDKCFICHGPDQSKVKGGLQLHLRELAYAESKNTPGIYAIRPKEPANSEIIRRILTKDAEIIMPEPSSHLNLSAREKALLVKWVEEGAEYKDHWAFLAPKKVALPDVSAKELVSNPIDNFVLARLEEKNKGYSARADKEILLRRLSLDLTGLPPTLEEIENFLKDTSSDAYEKQVDRLLTSPHYGEQMTLDWMDLSRYADTHGYTVDRYRDVSKWRDWVIKAFNENMPYDQFITWQLAGDLMPNASTEQVLATTFNRLHPQNAEGGIIDEEFRAEYVADRTNTVSEGLLGLTMACAKCHDHKYDPISQKNYYEMYSFFNNVRESGQISFDWSMPAPTLLLPTKEQNELLASIDALIDDKRTALQDRKSQGLEKAKAWLQSGNQKSMATSKVPQGRTAFFDFEGPSLANKERPGKKGIMKRQHSKDQQAKFSKGFEGYGLQLDGDAWLDLNGVGIFHRNESFSVSIRIYIPEDLETGVIIHKGIGAKLYNFRGYHLALKDNKLEVLFAHLHPANAIVKYSTKKLPKEKWLQLTLTYDGSSKAQGIKVYQDDTLLDMETEVDNLYKDIVFNKHAYGMKGVPEDPGLQVGARWRGKGIGGAVVDDIQVYERALTGLEVLQLADFERFQKLLNKESYLLSEQERTALQTYYLESFDKSYQKEMKELELIKRKAVDTVDAIQDIMVMKEMEEKRETYVLERGQYDMPGDRVDTRTPERIFPYPDSLPKNRMGLAQWITDKKNPLTARVAVNRYWKNIFGTGIVRTVEDFGNQGELPSHPAMLDWLAIEFMESGWNVKSLMKMMVMSNAYRQASKSSPSLLAMDPDNRLLARGPSKRLTGEMLRNNVLVASGLMNSEIGGPSVRPYQPEGLWKINGASYKEDTGKKLYRRGMYTIWKRSVPNPTIATFDAPERSFCSVRRQETNTPLQALVVMNDPTYVEASRVLGHSMTAYSDIKEGIQSVFRRLTGRSASSKELEVLEALRYEEYTKFLKNPDKAKGWLNTGEFQVKSENYPLIAANAVVASTIMNSDATIMKR
ncbi:DUF1553 domain-containing protein [Pareuzebyella sediminis]|uniref:DUF1553 domain-containing protein n=1 Tax=Pareuzebyella sediminis TaxID=2607998 RepID=UPI0029391CDF|nr:DUF1553 domain-containing protein [Pareuzebyella sediminis]